MCGVVSGLRLPAPEESVAVAGFEAYGGTCGHAGEEEKMTNDTKQHSTHHAVFVCACQYNIPSSWF